MKIRNKEIQIDHHNIKTNLFLQVAHDFLPFGSTDVQLENSKRAIVTISNGKRSVSVCIMC